MYCQAPETYSVLSMAFIQPIFSPFKMLSATYPLQSPPWNAGRTITRLLIATAITMFMKCATSILGQELFANRLIQWSSVSAQFLWHNRSGAYPTPQLYNSTGNTIFMECYSACTMYQVLILLLLFF